MDKEKYRGNIVNLVVEPVNTTSKGRATFITKGVLLHPKEYLQALDRVAWSGNVAQGNYRAANFKFLAYCSLPFRDNLLDTDEIKI